MNMFEDMVGLEEMEEGRGGGRVREEREKL